MTQVLITGFQPFGGEAVNAAWEAVKTFESDEVPGATIYVRQLPTVYGEAPQVLKQAIREINPDIVLCVGEAGGRSAISFERIGVNLDHARIPDNAGNQPQEQPTVEDGPTAYWSRLPIADLVGHMKSAGIPAEESYTAGTFVCNHILYHLLHCLNTGEVADKHVLGGFIHVPYTPGQAVNHKNAPSLSSVEVKRGLRLVVEYLVRS